MKNDISRYKFIQAAAPLMQRLEGAGFEVYLVGGSVREILRAELGQTASAQPAQGQNAGLTSCFDKKGKEEYVSASGLAARPAQGQNAGLASCFDKKGKEEYVSASGLAARPAQGQNAGLTSCFTGMGEAARDKSTDARPVLLTDLDVTTDARPDQVCRIFGDMQVIVTGIKHGTVTVMAPFQGGRIPVEITTYRIDGSYSDGRHPDQVSFTASLTEDLRRRDFTVNAMAMDLRGQIVDPFGGQADLEAGIIRAVGNPEERMREDGLRILRALRFAAVLQRKPGYRIEPVTEEALRRCAPLLQDISAERIFSELKKLVCGPSAAEVLRRYVDILGEVIPELASMKGFAQNNPYHKHDVLEHCILAMEAVREVPALDAAGSSAMPQGFRPRRRQAESRHAPLFCMKLAALLHDVGKPVTYSEDEKGIGHFYGHPQAGEPIARRILQRLKADRFTIDRICTLVRYHDLVFQEDPRLLKRWMNRRTPQVLLEILELKRADNIATGSVSRELLEKFDRIETMIRDILRQDDCFQIGDLAVTGKDLICIGIPEGPQIGDILQKLLDAVIDGQLPNQTDALLRHAKAGRADPCPGCAEGMD